jgi:hypothetical protein
VLAFQDYQLLPQCYDFQSQVITRPNKASQPREHTPNQPKRPNMNPFYTNTKRLASQISRTGSWRPTGTVFSAQTITTQAFNLATVNSVCSGLK